MPQRNLFLALALSLGVVMIFQYLQPPAPPHPVAAISQSTDASASPSQTTGTAGAPIIAGGKAQAAITRAALLSAGARIVIDTPRLKGSIALKGARFDDLELANYHETIDPKSPDIVILSPAGANDAYYAVQGWTPDVPGISVPDQNTPWQAAAGARLTPGSPVTLTWNNGAGLVFTRTISVDHDYMFTVADTVENTGAAPVGLRPYALISRAYAFLVPPGKATGAVRYSHTGMVRSLTGTSTFISYEGPIGGYDNGVSETKYKALDPENPVTQSSNGGWVGFTDKYWLTSIAPLDQTAPVTGRFSVTAPEQRFQADWLGGDITIAPHGSAHAASLVFAGAKEVAVLNRYEKDLHLKNFDDAVDWGWFFFFTKPIFFVLDYINAAVGNFGIAILILTVLVKVAFFPLANRSFANVHKMKKLAPELAKLKEKFADDKERLTQETMALYKKAGANPIAGCLPLLVQIPVFFSLYKVLYVGIEMWHAPFYGWIHDLSSPDPTTIFNLFGLIPWTPPAFLPVLGIWPLIYCATMYTQQMMQPPPPDPVQARMMKAMPFVFTLMMGNFPAGLLIYWSWNNTLSVLQQWVITRRLDSVSARVPLAAE